MKKVSIIIPTYNTLPDYLERCLESVMNQTMNAEDYEVLIIDDCSTNDETLVVLNENIAKFPHLIIFEQLGENSGTASAPRNRGIDLASGEYVFFVDSDDSIGHESLERMYNLGKANNADSITGKHDDTQREKPAGYLKYGNLGVADIFFHKLAAQANILRMFKREVLIERKIYFDLNLKKREDMLFFTEFLANSNYHSTITDYTCYFATRHDGPHLSRYSPSMDEYIYFINRTFEAIYKGAAGSMEFKNRLSMTRLNLILSIPTIFRNFLSEHIGDEMKNGYLNRLSNIINGFIPFNADQYMNERYRYALNAIRKNDLTFLQLSIKHLSTVDDVNKSKELLDLMFSQKLNKDIAIAKMKTISLDQLRKETNFYNYVILLKAYSERLTILMTVSDTPYRDNNSENNYKALRCLGFNTDLLRKNRHSFVGIISKGIVIKEILGLPEDKAINYSTKIGDINIDLTSASFFSGALSKTIIDGTDYSPNIRGLNFVVINSECGDVIDAAAFDVWKNFKCTKRVVSDSLMHDLY